MERRLITSDCHIAPPFSLFDEAPAKYRDYFPRVEHRADGDYLVRPNVPPELMGATGRARTMAQTSRGRTMGVVDGNTDTRLDDARATARVALSNVCGEAEPTFDPAEMLAELERDGVYGAVLIGRFDDFDIRPNDADIAYCELVNDYLADTWRPYLDRVAPGIHLPLQDIAASVKELERAAALGLRPVLMPDGIFERPYFLPEWEPVWEACNALRMPITMHVGNRLVPAAVERAVAPGQAYIGWYDQCVAMGDTLGWLTFSGVFERYPDIHVVMTEGYAAWLAFAIQFWDHHWVDSRFANLRSLVGGESAARIEAPPSFYLKRQAHATFMWDPIAIRERAVTGLDCLLWGNDYPHHEGSFPDSQAWIDKMFEGVPEDEVNQMVRGNAARIFGITI